MIWLCYDSHDNAKKSISGWNIAPKQGLNIQVQVSPCFYLVQSFGREGQSWNDNKETNILLGVSQNLGHSFENI